MSYDARAIATIVCALCCVALFVGFLAGCANKCPPNHRFDTRPFFC